MKIEKRISSNIVYRDNNKYYEVARDFSEQEFNEFLKQLESKECYIVDYFEIIDIYCKDCVIEIESNTHYYKSKHEKECEQYLDKELNLS